LGISFSCSDSKDNKNIKSEQNNVSPNNIPNEIADEAKKKADQKAKELADAAKKKADQKAKEIAELKCPKFKLPCILEGIRVSEQHL
jgi:hypothetical protein